MRYWHILAVSLMQGVLAFQPSLADEAKLVNKSQNDSVQEKLNLSPTSLPGSSSASQSAETILPLGADLSSSDMFDLVHANDWPFYEIPPSQISSWQVIINSAGSLNSRTSTSSSRRREPLGEIVPDYYVAVYSNGGGLYFKCREGLRPYYRKCALAPEYTQSNDLQENTRINF